MSEFHHQSVNKHQKGGCESHRSTDLLLFTGLGIFFFFFNFLSKAQKAVFMCRTLIKSHIRRVESTLMTLSQEGGCLYQLI